MAMENFKLKVDILSRIDKLANVTLSPEIDEILDDIYYIISMEMKDYFNSVVESFADKESEKEDYEELEEPEIEPPVRPAKVAKTISKPKKPVSKTTMEELRALM